MSREILLRRLARNPFVTLNEDRIRTRAYFHAENRTGSAWWDSKANWLQAELEEIELAAREGLILTRCEGALDARPLEFERNYELLVSLNHPFEGLKGKTQYLGARNPRRCSLCGQGRPDVTFKQQAHVIPESFGNKSIITLDECDSCNGELGRELDNELANMFLLARALGRVPAKKNPTARVKVASGHRSSIGGKHRDDPVSIELVEGDNSVELARDEDNSFTIRAPHISFRPISAIRSFVKTTWQALPSDRRERFAELRSFVLGEFKILPSILYQASIPGTDWHSVRLVIWERVSHREELPSLVALLAFYNQIIIWSAPDSTSRQHQPALLPPLPKSPLPNHPVICEQHTFNSDDKRLLSGSASIGYEEMYLVSSRDPIPVKLEATRASANITIETSLQTPPPPKPLPEGHSYYEIEGGRLAGRMRLIHFQGGLHAWLESKPEGRTASDVRDTARMFLALRSGASMRIVETSSGHAAFTQGSVSVDGLSIDILEELEKVAEALTTINAAFSVELNFPAQLSQEDHIRIAILNAAIKHGKARVRDPGRGFEQRINRHRFEQLAVLLAEGPAKLGLEAPSSCELLGVRLETGPCRLTLENARFDRPAEELRASFIGEDDETLKPVTIVCDSIIYEFSNWLRE